MKAVVASFFSPLDASAGLLVYDLDLSESRYMQLIDLEDIPLRMNHLRGISIIGTRLYAVVPCALLIFRIDSSGAGPMFVLEKKVVRPEWMLGGKLQGDLHAVHASKSREKVYVSFNAIGAIDVLDLDGNFIERKYLWELSPKNFPIPTKKIKGEFQFGIVRHIFESHSGRLLLTTALLNGTKEGAVIDYDNGKTVIGPIPNPPHSGFVHQNQAYICSVRDAEIQSFQWLSENSEAPFLPTTSFTAQELDQDHFLDGIAVRGITRIGKRLISGVFYLGKEKKRTPWLAEFDMDSGKQIRSHLLPSFEGIRNIAVYALLPATREIESAIFCGDSPIYYNGGMPFQPVPLTVESRSENELLSPAKNRKYSTSSQSLIDKTIEDASNKENIDSTLFVDEPAIKVEEVGISFNWMDSYFHKFFKRSRSDNSFWALRKVSFEISDGDTLGIIGRNGSGKSTLAMVCTGVYEPDEGEVQVNGRVQLLSLGIGFRKELTGRENVMISASLMGLSKQEIHDKMDEIVDFSEIGPFIDEAVRTYSSGMRSRLGFAIATAVEPEILILDEVLSTGDQAFRDKAMKRMQEMRSKARSVILISHQRSQLKKICNKILWLEKGRVMMQGPPKSVLNEYDRFCKDPEKWISYHQSQTSFN